MTFNDSSGELGVIASSNVALSTKICVVKLKQTTLLILLNLMDRNVYIMNAMKVIFVTLLLNHWELGIKHSRCLVVACD